MGKIKYSYCLNENNELVHISSVSAENRHSHTYCCLECGQPMVPRLGEDRKWHFAHKADTACDGESYLHKLAKRRIRDYFMSADSFPITFIREVPCQDKERCFFFDDHYCVEWRKEIPFDLKRYKGKEIYDDCQEEVPVGDFRPDLLLTNRKKPEWAPVFIEVYKTHKSEGTKLNSEYKIIETMKIKSEADIDDIINRGFVEEDNCKTHNFRPLLPPIEKKDVPLDRFIFFKSGAAKMVFATEYEVMCDKLNVKYKRDSVLELNMKRDPDVYGDLGLFRTGLVYAMKKGFDFKNCIMCINNKYNSYYSCYICTQYKALGADSPRPKQSAANKCPRYVLNQALLDIPLTELEKVVSEVTDEHSNH